MNIENHGFIPSMAQDNDIGIPARITACHKNKFEFICDNGEGLAHLKTSEYFVGSEIYPTTGDFVLIDYRTDGESVILKTFLRKTCFKRLDPRQAAGVHKQLRQTLIMCLLCSHSIRTLIQIVWRDI